MLKNIQKLKELKQGLETRRRKRGDGYAAYMTVLYLIDHLISENTRPAQVKRGQSKKNGEKKS